MSLLAAFLNIVEHALQNPEDKAAVKIAIDGLAAWREVSALASVQELEADIGTYVALLPKAEAPAPAPPPPDAAPTRNQTPTDLNLWEQEHPGQ